MEVIANTDYRPPRVPHTSTYTHTHAKSHMHTMHNTHPKLKKEKRKPVRLLLKTPKVIL